jgi:hypothetical protein
MMTKAEKAEIAALKAEAELRAELKAKHTPPAPQQPAKPPALGRTARGLRYGILRTAFDAPAGRSRWQQHPTGSPSTRRPGIENSPTGCCVTISTDLAASDRRSNPNKSGRAAAHRLPHR